MKNKVHVSVVAPLLVLGAIALVTACSDDAAAPAQTVDAGAAVDAAPDTSEAASGDAALDADAPVTCDLGVAPSPLPMVTSEYTIEGVDAGDGGAAPTATGGDETGTWVYTNIHVYLPPGAAGLFDPALSTVEGSGWLAATGGTFRQLVDTTSKLETAAGAMVRVNNTKATGTYVKKGTALTLTTTCREGAGDTTPTQGDIGFSRIDATHARLHIVSNTQIGVTTLVVDLESRP